MAQRLRASFPRHEGGVKMLHKFHGGGILETPQGGNGTAGPRSHGNPSEAQYRPFVPRCGFAGTEDEQIDRFGPIGISRSEEAIELLDIDLAVGGENKCIFGLGTKLTVGGNMHHLEIHRIHLVFEIGTIEFIIE